MRFREKYDKGIFGLLTALFLPVIGFFLSYLVKYYPRPLKGFWGVFMYNQDEQTQIFTFSMVPSLLLFYFILFQWKMEVASKAYVGVSLIYVTIFVYIKFL